MRHLAHREKTIKKITIIYSDHSKISERPVHTDNAYESLIGKMSSFSFLMLGFEQIARRERSCWCAAGCMHAKKLLVRRGVHACAPA